MRAGGGELVLERGDLLLVSRPLRLRAPLLLLQRQHDLLQPVDLLLLALQRREQLLDLVRLRRDLPVHLPGAQLAC